jgi:hypothetical protein
MAEFKLSRIRFTWAGDWTAGTAYVKDQIVSYGAKTYVCLKGHTAQTNFYDDVNDLDTTTIPSSPDPKWELMIDGYQWKGDWTSPVFYNLGDIVKYQGVVYICIDPHTSNIVSLDSTKWISYARGEYWKGDWQANTRYLINDIVKYSGILYRCLFEHSSSSFSAGIESSPAFWETVVSGDFWRLDWTPATRYRENDIVKYGGIVYRCIAYHTSAGTEELGLEDDFSSWEIVHSNIEYKGDYVFEVTTFPTSPGVRYKLNDVVKYGAGLWICTAHHTSTEEFDTNNWTIYIPGLEYEALWSPSTVYQKGDVVKYGGYSYTALTNNINQPPSFEPDDSSIADWKLLTIGYKAQGEWLPAVTYRIGDTVRRNGQVYVAVADISSDPNIDSVNWELVIPGDKFLGEWDETTASYAIGDIVTFDAHTYRCIHEHSAPTNLRPDLDPGVNWTLHVYGEPTNRLRTQGDIKIFGTSEDQSSSGLTRLPIGTEGQVLQVYNSAPSWQTFNSVNKIYFVGPDGLDAVGNGESLQDPWRTVRYACQSITGPATIYVKAGLYEEILPIKIPRDVAIVGEELRSTVIKPAAGYETYDMFHVNNGTGLRNMTFRGLSGVLGPYNQYLTRRPNAGAYVSLDPGYGPDDSSVWIISKSCYVQNVTTFGTGCVGLKVDGALHNGGNRSIVANDFTQVLSDGIGVWVTNKGLSELVSVFSYYGHIGYLAENGGKIRATNGNSSYGMYGTVAEGVDENEVPTTGVLNNRNRQTVIRSAFSGEANDEILKLEFSNAGEHYTSATYTFVGSGVNAAVIGNEFRDYGVFETRLLDPIDSTGSVGGSGYLSTGNNAQAGDPYTVTIASNDENTLDEYNGCRLIIQSGTGTGQYGYIVSYDLPSKIIGIANEDFDRLIISATSSTNNLFTTSSTDTLRVGMPVYINYENINLTAFATVISGNRITVGDTSQLVVGMPIEFTNPIGNVAGATVYYIQSIPNGTQITISTSNGGSVYTITTASTTSVSARAGGILGGVTEGQLYYIISANLSSTQFAVSDTEGGSAITLTNTVGRMYLHRAGWSHAVQGYPAVALLDTTSVYRIEPRVTYSKPPFAETAGSLGTSASWISSAYGAGKYVAISTGGTYTSSTTGASWSGGTLPPTSGTWSSVTYGANGFVAVSAGATAGALSTNGTSWSSISISGSAQNWSSVAYDNGTYVAVSATSGTSAIYSTDGTTWADAVLPTTGIWSCVAGGLNKFVAIRTSSNKAAYSSDGITWVDATMPTSTTWSSVTFGNGRFVAVATGGDLCAYSFDGINWNLSYMPASTNWTSVSYGQGLFVAVSASNTSTIACSQDGYIWEKKTLTGSIARSSVVFGNTGSIGRWLTIPNAGSTLNIVNYGAKALARVEVQGGQVGLVKLWEPGSGYTTEPTFTLTDPNNNQDVYVENRVSVGVLGNPTFTNRGIGYKTSTTRVTVAGDGFADIFPLGRDIVVNNVTRIPRTGANLTIDQIVWETASPPVVTTWAKVTYGTDRFVAIASGSSNVAAYSLNGTGWSTTTLPAVANWKSLAFGNGTFVAISSGGTTAASSIDGVVWSLSTLPASANWSSIAFGSGTFVAVASGSNVVAYSTDNGASWASTTLGATTTWNNVAYGSEGFMAIASGGTVAATSTSGVSWQAKSLPASANWTGLAAYQSTFVVTAAGTDLAAVSTDFGENWTTSTLPAIADWTTITFGDRKFLAISSSSDDAATTTDGLTWKTRTYPLSNTTTAANGNGLFVTLSSTSIGVAPDGSTATIYRVLTVDVLSGTAPNLKLALNVSPAFTRTTAPDHGVDVEIREKYSQVRLTGHDFLEIGTGNFIETNYPNVDTTNLQPDKETYYRGGGRVFYTSTDQDGNFRVGELFAVDQATGVVTISADYFDLSGLSEIRLGGIRVGGTGVVIREFSTDATFTADSNNVVPTEKAIKAYIERRISGGGSDAATGTLVAGTVRIGPDQIGSTTGLKVNIPVVVYFKKSPGGNMLAMSMFADGFNSGLDYQELGRDLG